MSFWPVDGILFQEHPFSSSSNNQLTWQRFFSLCTCGPLPKCLDGSAPHVRHSRHHNLMERKSGVKIKSSFSATNCTSAIHTNPTYLLQVLCNFQLWNFPENHSKVFQSKFQCCDPDAKSSALFFWKFEIPDEVNELLFCDLVIGGICAWRVPRISWSWWLQFFAVWRNTVFVVRVHSKIVRRFRNRKSIAMRHRPNFWWYMRIHKCWYFLHGHTIWIGVP